MRRILKILAWCVACLIFISISLSLLLLIPSVQSYVVNKAATVLSEKTQMKVEVGGVHISFPKTVSISGVYVEDKVGDTLLFCQDIDVDIELLPLIRKKVNVSNFEISGLKGKVYRNQGDSIFNYSPILEAFAKNDNQEEEPTTKSEWDIGIEHIELAEILVDYADHVDSIFVKLKLGLLEVDINESDILNSKFAIGKVNLEETSFLLALPEGNKKVISENEESDPLSLDLSLELLSVSNISFQLTIGQENLALNTFLEKAQIKPKSINFANSTIQIEELETEGIDVSLSIISDTANVQNDISSSEAIENRAIPDYTLGEFDWNFLVDHVDIKNTSYKMDLDKNPRLAAGMDYSHMDFKDFHVNADNVFFNKNTTGAKVHSLAVKELCGAEVQHLSGNFHMDNQNISASEIVFKTPKSQLGGEVKLSYPALRLIGQEIQQFGIVSDVTANIALDEIKPFTSAVDQQPLLAEFKNIKVEHFKSEGVLGDLMLKDLNCTLADSTMFKFHGHVTGLPTANLKIAYSIDTFQTNRRDLMKFLPDTLIPTSIHVPQAINLSAHGETDMENGRISSILNTDAGKVFLDFVLEDQKFDGHLDVVDLNVGAILADTLFGKLSFETQVNGNMQNFKPVEFETETVISALNLNQHSFKNSTIKIDLKNDVYACELKIPDSSLTATLDGTYFSRDSVNNIILNLDVEALELSGLNLSDDYFSTSGSIQIEFHGKTMEEHSASLTMSEIRMLKPESAFLVKELKFESEVNEKSSNFQLTSDFMDASLTGNTRIAELKSAILDHLDRYIQLPDSIISDKEFEFEFNLNLKDPAIFTHFLVPDLKEIQLDSCYAYYDDLDDILTMKVSLPKLQYQDFHINQLSIDFDTKQDSAITELKIGELILNSIPISNISIRSLFEMDHATINFHINDTTDRLQYQLISYVDYTDSIYRISLDPTKIFIDYENWSLPENNLLLIGNNYLQVQAAELTHENQKVVMQSEGRDLNLVFEDFNVDNLTHILSQDTLIKKINGPINGRINMPDFLTALNVNSDLTVSALSFGEHLIGDLNAGIEIQSQAPVKFDVQLKNETNLLHAVGTTGSAEQNQNINMMVETDINDFNVFEPLFLRYLKRLDGSMKGRMAVNGSPQNPSINGSFDFKNLDVVINPTNTRLNTNGQILVDNNLLSLNSFTIRDSLKNEMKVTGQINLKNYLDPVYNVEISADKFLFVNTPLIRQEVIEGKLNLGIDLKINGRKSKLKVDNRIKINDGTDIIYTMPGNELELITDEGIVEYVDFDHQLPDTFLVENQKFIGDSLVSLIKGIDFSTFVDINPKASFTVLVDPNSGDYTKFNLTGKLQYIYNDSRRGHLTGLLEFEKGFYELSFYGLVKKRFDYEPGSLVSWSGNVMDGDLNFSARYTVRTNSIGLVSNEISSYERALYNQRLPYDVILKIENKISSPSISFGIDLPERYRSTYPTLDSKLNYLNQPSMESERNKQVFALLVGGTFIPEDPSITEGSGGSNFATTAARNSVNAIMTQQLNNLTGQIIQGFEIDMGVNTIEDYNTGRAQSRTQLDVKVSKNLFNNRVTAEVESHINLDGSVKEMGNQSNAGMTEFAVSYNLTESGNYRIKAFKENAYDIFDGEIQNSGIAFIFIKEFESFRRKKNEVQLETDEQQEGQEAEEGDQH